MKALIALLLLIGLTATADYYIPNFQTKVLPYLIIGTGVLLLLTLLVRVFTIRVRRTRMDQVKPDDEKEEETKLPDVVAEQTESKYPIQKWKKRKKIPSDNSEIQRN